MGWSSLPCTKGDKIIKSWFDELRAAIYERMEAGGIGGAPAVVSEGDLIDLALMKDYQDAIEDVIKRFYKKSGSGVDTTFTQWTKAEIMTECFGEGVTDWPHKIEYGMTDKKLVAGHFNDWRTVLNKLNGYWTRVTYINVHRDAFYDESSPASGASKDDAQDDYDAANDENVKMGGGICGIVGSYYTLGGNYYVKYSAGQIPGRDRQSIIYFTMPDVDILDIYLRVYIYNYEGSGVTPNAPEQDADYYFYAGTDTPPTTFAGVRSYGTLANEGGAAITISGLIVSVMKSFHLDENKFTKNVQNHIRMKGKPTINRELTDLSWPASPTEHTFMQAIYGGNPYLCILPDFEYKAV